MVCGTCDEEKRERRPWYMGVVAAAKMAAASPVTDIEAVGLDASSNVFVVASRRP
jgi:hypothetical protein